MTQDVEGEGSEAIGGEYVRCCGREGTSAAAAGHSFAPLHSAAHAARLWEGRKRQPPTLLNAFVEWREMILYEQM